MAQLINNIIISPIERQIKPKSKRLLKKEREKKETIPLHRDMIIMGNDNK